MDGTAAATATAAKRSEKSMPTCVCALILLLHGTFGRVSLAVFAFLARVAKVAAGTIDYRGGTAHLHHEGHEDFSATLCRAVALAAPIHTQFHKPRKAVLVGISVPTGKHVQLVGHSTSVATGLRPQGGMTVTACGRTACCGALLAEALGAGCLSMGSVRSAGYPRSWWVVRRVGGANAAACPHSGRPTGSRA